MNWVLYDANCPSAFESEDLSVDQRSTLETLFEKFDGDEDDFIDIIDMAWTGGEFYTIFEFDDWVAALQRRLDEWNMPY